MRTLLPWLRSSPSRIARISRSRRLSGLRGGVVATGDATASPVASAAGLATGFAGAAAWRSEAPSRAGRCSTDSGRSSQSTSACSITLANSRMLPGQRWWASAANTSAIATSASGGVCGLAFRTKCRTNSGRSSIRSRSGGIAISNVLIRNSRSSRNSPSATISSRERCVAQTTRTSTVIGWLSPTRRISPLSSARSSRDCNCLGSSPISSRKRVPPSATSKSPARCSSAPVKAPLRWPNSSLSTRCSGSAPQLTATSGPPARGLPSWMALATNSLPVPVSPRMSTFESLAATRATSRRTRANPEDAPTSWLVPSARRTRRSSARSRLVSSRFFRTRSSTA